MFDVAVEQIVKVKPPKTAVVYKALLIIGCIVAATPYHRQEHLE